MMPQMPSREKLLAWIDQVSFAVLSNGLCSHGRGKSTGKEGADGCGIMKNASSIL